MVPVGSKWGLLVLASGEQTFENIEGTGQLFGRQKLALNSVNVAKFQVVIQSDASARFVLYLNGQPDISWEGPTVMVNNGGSVWGVGDPATIGLDTKSGKIMQMQLIAPANQIKTASN